MNPLIYFSCLTGLLVIVWFFVVILGHNRRVKRALRAFQLLPAEVARQAIEMIGTLAKHHPAVTFLQPNVNVPCDEPAIHLRSHVGGVPYAEAGTVWPTRADDTDQPHFLIQVLLDDPELGPVWQGRLIQVFLVFDHLQIVISHAQPSLDRYVPLPSPVEPTPCIVLSHFRIPVQDAAAGKRHPASTARLLEMSPELSRLLKPYARDTGGLLTQVLRPNIYRYDLEPADVAYIGGDPTWIQGEPVPVCQVCQQPMRFLFLFGEIIPEVQLADAGICYVHGCDDHPDQLVAQLDSH